MAKFLVNMNDVNFEATYEPLLPGVYEVVVDASKAEIKEASTGTPQLRLDFIVTSPEEYAGRRVVEFFALTEKARWRLGQLLTAMEATLPTNLAEVEIDTDRWHNCPCKLVLKQEAHNGEIRHRVAKILPAASGQPVSVAEAPRAVQYNQPLVPPEGKRRVLF
jgi:hypothetical protein